MAICVPRAERKMDDPQSIIQQSDIAVGRNTYCEELLSQTIENGWCGIERELD